MALMKMPCAVGSGGNGEMTIVELGSASSSTQVSLNATLNDSLSNYKFIVFGGNTTLNGQEIKSSGSARLMAIDDVEHFKNNAMATIFPHSNGSSYNITFTYVDDTTINITNNVTITYKIYGIK